MPNRFTLTKYLIQERRRHPAATGDFNGLLLDVATACKSIAAAVSRGALAGRIAAETAVNVQGELQKPLDVIANEIVIHGCDWGGNLAAMASEEMEDVYRIAPPPHPRGRYLLVFDPLDGSSNIDVNVAAGTIFSILRAQKVRQSHALKIFFSREPAGCCGIRHLWAFINVGPDSRSRRSGVYV